MHYIKLFSACCFLSLVVLYRIVLSK